MLFAGFSCDVAGALAQPNQRYRNAMLLPSRRTPSVTSLPTLTADGGLQLSGHHSFPRRSLSNDVPTFIQL